MRRLSFAAFSFLLVLVLVASSRSEAQQSSSKPYVDREIIVSSISPPRTVPEMVAAADAVVVGRYMAGGRFVEFESIRDVPTLPMTAHPFELVTVVRAFARLPGPSETIEVKLYGGQREHDTYIERISVRGQGPLVVGHLYVVFLKWDERRQVFDIPWYAASIYDVSGDSVRTLFQVDRAYTGKRTKDFLSETGLQDWVPPEPRP